MKTQPSSPNPSGKTSSAEIREAMLSVDSNTPASDEWAVSTGFSDALRGARDGSLAGPALARLIDHTLLRADARRHELDRLCEEARAHAFATVCVNTSALPIVVPALAGAKTLPIAVVGFPLGAMETRAKALETARAVELGAREIDMVLPIGALKDGNHDAVETDISAVVAAAGSVPVKVILETALLSRDEIVAACVLSRRAGAAFVKTSTGFATPPAGKSAGATAEDVALMRKVVGASMGVKASGGIRTRQDALRMIAAGANRIGASASAAIATDTKAASGGY
jgi:deoxyribose-phosphate aldolase